MYIIELINKIKNRKKEKNKEFVEEEAADKAEELENPLTCEHVFMPIDSTKTVLACSKCGYVIKNSKMKFSEFDKNPFKNL